MRTRRALFVILAILALAVVGRVLLPSRPAPSAPPNRAPTAAAPLTYDAALERATEQVEGAQQVAQSQANDWLPLERLALAWMAKARLTGDFYDYAQAQAALDRSFARARQDTGPHLTQASLDLSLHRLARAQAMLKALGGYAVPPDAGEAAEIAGMTGDIAFYRGAYDRAWKLYGGDDKAAAPGAFRRAVFLGHTGKIDAALAALNDAERGLDFPVAQTLAGLELQRGALELRRGDRTRATAHFAKAERLFPGYWLAEAHSAQMLALAGRRPEAIARMVAIAQRSGAPEVMDALAALYRAEGDYNLSKTWSDRAGAIWMRRVAEIPEAAWGHAIEHELAFGDPAQALEFARKDYAARPYGPAVVGLAWAEIAAGRPAEALRVLQALDAGPYVSADRHVAAAQAYLLLGQDAAAEAERKKALALNPHSLDRDSGLIWFGH
ncbi:hypothetical protein [uncultured Phenylobacterium sp.]|uniref:hypothetical protein n=1 Tax=uncultured Phenylobacterium sp. TaxID=349273 RepID=UPI0025FC14B5|nr:hypothetical protein [uncultured Phenylobacterium sp.]